MRIKHFLAIAASVFLFGCASVPMESKEASLQAKQFNPPSEGKAGLYIYREGGVGGALRKIYGSTVNALESQRQKCFSTKKLKETPNTLCLPNQSFLLILLKSPPTKACSISLSSI